MTVVNTSGESATFRAGSWSRAAAVVVVALRGQAARPGREGKRDAAPDGALDATFKVTVEPAAAPAPSPSWSSRAHREQPLGHDRDQRPWILGAAAGLDSPLLNTSNGSVSFATGDGQSFYLFARDPTTKPVPTGAQLRLRAVMADGSSTTADTTVSAAPTLSAVSPQQALRGQTLSVTVTGSNFQTGASVSFGAGTNVTATTSAPRQA